MFSMYAYVCVLPLWFDNTSTHCIDYFDVFLVLLHNDGHLFGFVMAHHQDKMIASTLAIKSERNFEEEVYYS